MIEAGLKLANIFKAEIQESYLSTHMIYASRLSLSKSNEIKINNLLINKYIFTSGKMIKKLLNHVNAFFLNG